MTRESGLSGCTCGGCDSCLRAQGNGDGSCDGEGCGACYDCHRNDAAREDAAEERAEWLREEGRDVFGGGRYE